MHFNINEVLAGMANEVKDSLAEDWPEAKSVLNRFLQNRRARLELLAELRFNNEISHDDLISRLEDEKLLLDSELHTIAIIGKAAAQRAANAAIGFLEDAIVTAVRTI